MFEKPKTENITPAPSLRMTVMPEDFFGGKDPVVHYQKGASGAVSASRKSSVMRDKKSRMLVSMCIGAAGVAVIAGISWYYISQAMRQAAYRGLPPAAMAEPETAAPSAESVSSLPPVTTFSPTSTESSAVSSTLDTGIPSVPPLSLGESSIDFPRSFFTDSPDLDGDSLTDAEEELFGTDTGVYDTDGDGYTDGQEVENLYNPRGVAPVKLIDSGLVEEYVHPTRQYRLYYPQGWEASFVDTHGDQVLFSAITGDYLEVRAVNMHASESFSEWFGRVAGGEQFSDLETFTNRFRVQGYRRRDHLAAYIPSDGIVYIILYHPKASAAVPFRHIMDMMMQSFRTVFTSAPQ